MPKKIKPVTGYVDKIPSLEPLLRQYQAKPKDFEKRPAWATNRFLRIEALLRSDDARKAFDQGRSEGLKLFFANHGFKENFLTCSHHALLTGAPNLRHTEEVKGLGEVDNQLGIQDFSLIARLTPDTNISRGNNIWVRYDGERTVFESLRNPDPRFIYLRFDASHNVGKILKSTKLRSLFKERHELYEKSFKQSKNKPSRSIGTLIRPLPAPFVGPPAPLGNAISPKFAEQLNKWSFIDSIGTWLQYFWCFELQQKGSEPNVQAIADKVYGVEDDGALSKAEQGMKRVREMIRAALDNRFPDIR